MALPLQGRALKQGNSAFIDEVWNAYPDQWQKLRSVKKLTESQIMEKLIEWNRASIEGLEQSSGSKIWGCSSATEDQALSGKAAER